MIRNPKPLHVGIDASNIRAGGGITHLAETLNIVDPADFGVQSATVWSGKVTLDHLPDKPWLTKKHDPQLDRSLPSRISWQTFKLEKEASREGCDILFIPGGLYLGSFRPFVTMSQNMLPFQAEERARYGISPPAIKLYLLYFGQRFTFQRADGMIFLSNFAQKSILRQLPQPPRYFNVIPHGVNTRFFLEPREQFSCKHYSDEQPVRILYVSALNAYKHHWNVVEAVAMLKQKGLPVVLDLIGGTGHLPSFRKLATSIQQHDPSHEFINYLGELPFRDVHHSYHNADLFVFASTCENLPNILLEAMASGLPIACSNRGPMPETLGDGGMYFDPEVPADIANKIEQLLNEPALRRQFGSSAYEKAKQFDWERCAKDTFEFLVSVASQKDNTFQPKEN